MVEGEKRWGKRNARHNLNLVGEKLTLRRGAVNGGAASVADGGGEGYVNPHYSSAASCFPLRAGQPVQVAHAVNCGRHS